MTCADITGLWIEGILVVDTTDDVTIDPSMRIFMGTDGKLKVRFTGDAAVFDVNCRTSGEKTTMDITRTHNDRTTTRYEGRVVDFGARGVVGIIRGRFVRNTPENLAKERGILATTNGDWETEKPT